MDMPEVNVSHHITAHCTEQYTVLHCKLHSTARHCTRTSTTHVYLRQTPSSLLAEGVHFQGAEVALDSLVPVELLTRTDFLGEVVTEVGEDLEGDIKEG